MPASAFALINPCFHTFSCASAGADHAARVEATINVPIPTLRNTAMRMAKFLPVIRFPAASSGRCSVDVYTNFTSQNHCAGLAFDVTKDPPMPRPLAVSPRLCVLVQGAERYVPTIFPYRQRHVPQDQRRSGHAVALCAAR